MSKKIMVDPAQLTAASSKIDGQAADYERLYNQLFNEVKGLGASWQGKDNTAFVQQIETYRADFEKMTSLMREYSTFLAAAAQQYRNTQDTVESNAKSI